VAGKQEAILAGALTDHSPTPLELGKGRGTILERRCSVIIASKEERDGEK